MDIGGGTVGCKKFGEGGHIGKDCHREPFCLNCKASGHGSDSGRCPLFRDALRKIRLEEKGLLGLHGMKCLQINLGRDKIAHDLAFATAAEISADIIAVCEPNKRIVEKVGWVSDERKDVGIYFRNKRLRVDGIRSRRGFLAVSLGAYDVICCYVSPNILWEEYQRKIDEIMDCCRGSDKYVLIGDFNAKSPLWGSPQADRRGVYLEECLASAGLVVQNCGGKPTFVRGQSRSHLDLTMASASMARCLSGWMVLEEETATQHRYISFSVLGRAPNGGGWGARPKDWVLFRETFSRLYATVAERDGLDIVGFMDAVKTSYRGCLGDRTVRRQSPYWWNEEIALARRSCLQSRRRLKRSRVNVEAALEDYRTKRKLLRTKISTAKRDHWRDLCLQLELNPWGDAYRIVMSKFGRKAPELVIERQREIARTLFIMEETEEIPTRRTDDFEPFTLEDISKAVEALKTGKAAGPDGIPPEAIKAAGGLAGEWLREGLNKLLELQVFPDSWKSARLVLIPKGGVGENKFRPICLLNAVSKVYEALIKNRLEAELESGIGLSPHQFGFRKGRSTIDAISQVTDLPRSVKWAAVVTLDVENAFNSLPWACVNEELRARRISPYLRFVIENYLGHRRLVIGKSEAMGVTAGVPQGSILGPLLWNVVYDGVLRLQWPRGVRVIGYADDLAIVAQAGKEQELVRNVEAAFDHIEEWMHERGMRLAPHKTEAVMLRGPRRRNEVIFTVGGVDISPKRVIKYLGVYLDDAGKFGKHVEEVVRKASSRASIMSRLMPNLGGPSFAKRRVLTEVVTSTLLYAVPAWSYALGVKRYANMLTRCQRGVLLRLACAYRTVSDAALQVVTGCIPMVLLAKERARLFARVDRTERAAKKEERLATLEEWQAAWENNREVGQWTKELIPAESLKEWVSCRHRDIGYFITQALTGHGCFGSYLHRIGKKDDEGCMFCEEVDTPRHTLFECARWTGARGAAEEELGERLGSDNLVPLMMQSINGWRIVANLITLIMREKGDEERRRQRPEVDRD